MSTGAESGANEILAAPAAALLIVYGAIALEKIAIVSLNAADKGWSRLKYGPSTDPHTWPSWEDAGLEKPKITVESLIGPEGVRELETRRLARESGQLTVLESLYGEGADKCPYLRGEL